LPSITEVIFIYIAGSSVEGGVISGILNVRGDEDPLFHFAPDSCKHPHR